MGLHRIVLFHWSIHPLHDRCNISGKYKGYIGGYNIDPIRLLVSTFVDFWPLVLMLEEKQCRRAFLEFGPSFPHFLHTLSHVSYVTLDLALAAKRILHDVSVAQA